MTADRIAPPARRPQDFDNVRLIAFPPMADSPKSARRSDAGHCAVTANPREARCAA